MVFILLTLLFQMVAAIARMEEGLKVNEAASIQAALYQDKPGALLLTFKANEVVADASESGKIKAWFAANAASIKEQGYTLSAVISADQADTGKKLSLQFSRLLEIKKQADELGVDQAQLQVVNRIDSATDTNTGQVQMFVGAP
jgi:hypothetical protein